MKSIHFTLLLLIFSLFPQFLFAESVSSTVTLPVEVYKEYLELKAEPKIPEVTILEEVRVSGTYSSGSLTLRMRGQSSKATPAKDFLIAPKGVRVSQCQGNAIVYRSANGFSLLPNAKKIDVTCRLRFGDQEALLLQFGDSVLDATVKVQGAEAIEQTSGGRGLGILLRKAYKTRKTDSREEAKVMVSPRYRLTVKSDETRFIYSLRFENPNSRSKSFQVPLLNGEKISRIDTNIPNEWKGEKIELMLKPGTSNVVLKGQLAGKEFQPLFQMEEQYLLLEFHPLVALKLKKSPPRIGVEQSRMVPNYDAAMAFLIGKGKSISWESKTREVFASESFAANSARYLIYIPERGESVIDASWGLQNQGKPSLRYELPGRALFASSGGKPQVLAKTEKNELFLPLRTGQTHVRVQYELPNRLPRPLGIWSTELVKPSVVLPSAVAEVRLGSRHKVVAAQFLSEITFPWFNGFQLVWALIVAFSWLLFLPRLGVEQRNLARLSALGLLSLGIFWSAHLGLALVALVIGFLLRYRKRIWAKFQGAGKIRWAYVLVGVCIFFVVSVFFIFSMSGLVRKGGRSSEGLMSQAVQSAGSYKAKRRAMAPMVAMDAEEEFDDRGEVQALKEESYLGLPVERVIPRGRTHLYLNESAIPEETKLPLRLFVISLLTSVFLALMGVLAWMGPLILSRQGILERVWKGEESNQI